MSGVDGIGDSDPRDPVCSRSHQIRWRWIEQRELTFIGVRRLLSPDKTEQSSARTRTTSGRNKFSYFLVQLMAKQTFPWRQKFRENVVGCILGFNKIPESRRLLRETKKSVVDIAPLATPTPAISPNSSAAKPARHRAIIKGSGKPA